MNTYGKELILDVYYCNPKKFTRKAITKYLKILCDKKLLMVREDLHWWDYENDPEEYLIAPAHLKGTSAVQFIRTSNITIHTLDDLKRIYINIFSCKDFSSAVARKFTEEYFGGKTINNNGIGVSICRV